MNETIQLASQAEDAIHCPKCGSTHIHADKKGFSGAKGCCGAIALGPLGLLCGTHKQNKVRITCLKCRHSW